MDAKEVVITIDGPAGAGKSSVARRVAARLGLAFLDTGAMYRAVALAALRRGLDPADAAAVGELARGLRISFDWDTDPPHPMLDGVDVSQEIRDPRVSAAASKVAAIPAVRQVLVEAQRAIGRRHPRLVTEGRDQGSVVFPQATVKFYLDASAQERARRRVADLKALGRDADEAQVIREILERDRRDSTRSDGPLICPDDALRVDSSDLTQEQVIRRLVELSRQKVPLLGGRP